MNKRASLADTISGQAYLLILGITMVIAVLIWNTVSDNMATLPLVQGNNGTFINESINTAINNIDVTFNTFDYMIPFIVGGLLISSTVLAYRRGSSILLIGLSLIFWVFALLLSSVFSNIFEQFAYSVATTMPQFTILAWVMENLKWIVLGWLFLLSTVMFTRNKREEENLQATEAAFMP